MKQLYLLVKRNVKIYFKDKGLFISSLITPVILLVLYATFLKKVYDDSLRSALEQAGVAVADSVVNACVGGQLVSSLLAVCCVTVAFCSNMLMIKDKASGAIKDLTVTPVKPGTLGLGYFLAALSSTLIVSLIALGASLIYLAAFGWCLTFGDVMLMLLDVILLTTFGTALSSCINFFLSSDGQASAVGTIVSSGYGFICGAYMPLASFDEGLRNVFACLPGTYGTSIIKDATLRGVFDEMRSGGSPEEAIERIARGVDCKVDFFGVYVSTEVSYIVFIASIILFIGLFVLMNVLSARKRNKQ